MFQSMEIVRLRLYRTFMITVIVSFMVLVVLKPVGLESVQLPATSELDDIMDPPNRNPPNTTETVTQPIGGTKPKPSVWDHGLYGLLFLLGAAFAPRFTLVFFAAIQWNFWFVLGVSLFPEFTLIFLAISRGYHHSNYLVLGMYVVWKLIDLHSVNQRLQAGDPTTASPSLLENIVRTVRNTDALQLLAATQETINIMKRHIYSLQHKVALLEMDPSAIKRLTTNQLQQLHDLMKTRIQFLEELLGNQVQVAVPLTLESCVICLSNPPVVDLRPCQHKCLCDECFFEWQERDESTCPLCRIPYLTFSFDHKNYITPISNEEYNRLGIKCTTEELLKLHKYVRDNPSVLKQLEKCNIKQFEQYM